MKNGVKLLFPWLWSKMAQQPQAGFVFYLSWGFWADGRSLGSTAGPGARLQGSPHCPPEYLCSRFCHLHRPPLPLHLCPPPPLFHPHLSPHPPRCHCSGAWVAPTYPGNANVFCCYSCHLYCYHCHHYHHLFAGSTVFVSEPWSRCSSLVSWSLLSMSSISLFLAFLVMRSWSASATWYSRVSAWLSVIYRKTKITKTDWNTDYKSLCITVNLSTGKLLIECQKSNLQLKSWNKTQFTRLCFS